MPSGPGCATPTPTLTAAPPPGKLAISSAGPLQLIYIGGDLSCQVKHVDDSDFEFYPPWQTYADCGTFLQVGQQLFAPRFTGHGTTATGNLGSYLAFTSVSQSSVTGAGTAGNPYQIVTVVDAGSTGVQLRETDSYVEGQESYTTTVELINNGSQPVTARLIRAGDCYLGNDDFGYGLRDTSRGMVACAKSANNSPPSRLLQWDPITAPDYYQEDFYGDLWATIGAGELNDSCDCGSFLDNSGALSWTRVIPAAQSASASHLTTFSPAGIQPLVMSKTADTSQIAPGGLTGYTINVSNPNNTSIALTSISDTLPAGFSYVSGSTSGATTSNPSVTGQKLSWSGSFSVPASGSISLHFSVYASSEAGLYCNSVSGSAGSYTVVPASNTACMYVGTPPTATSTATPCPAGKVSFGAGCGTPTPTLTPGSPTPTPTTKGTHYSLGPTGTATSTFTPTATQTPTHTPTATRTRTPTATVGALGTVAPTRTPGPPLGGVAQYPLIGRDARLSAVLAMLAAILVVGGGFLGLMRWRFR